MIELTDKERKEWHNSDELIEMLKTKYNSEEDVEKDFQKDLLDTIKGKYSIEDWSDKEVTAQIQYIFSRRLKELLTEKKMKQNELATITELKPSTINKYAKGSMFPNLQNLARIAKALEVTPSYLLGLNDIFCTENRQLAEIYDLFFSDKDLAYEFLNYSKDYIEMKLKTNTNENNKLIQIKEQLQKTTIKILDNIASKKGKENNQK